MNGYGTFKAVCNPQGYWMVVCDHGKGTDQVITVIENPSIPLCDAEQMCKRMAAGLNMDYDCSESDLGEVEARAKELQDCSKYGGGIIESLVFHFRKFKEQCK